MQSNLAVKNKFNISAIDKLSKVYSQIDENSYINRRWVEALNISQYFRDRNKFTTNNSFITGNSIFVQA